jgi:hypothetical protein
MRSRNAGSSCAGAAASPGSRRTSRPAIAAGRGEFLAATVENQRHEQHRQSSQRAHDGKQA